MTDDLPYADAQPLLRAVLGDPDGPALARVSHDAAIRAATPAFAAQLGVPPASIAGMSLERFLTHPGSFTALVPSGRAGEVRGPVLLNVVSPTGTSASLKCWVMSCADGFMMVSVPANQADTAHRQLLLDANTELASLLRLQTQEARVLEASNGELLDRIEELNTSWWHLRRDQDVLPICMGCTRVKAQPGEWIDLAEFMSANAGFLSHAYCPHCLTSVLASLG